MSLFYLNFLILRSTKFMSIFSPNHSITVPHSLCRFSNNSSGAITALHQIDGSCEMIGSVVIDWKTSKNVSCGTSMTDF